MNDTKSKQNSVCQGVIEWISGLFFSILLVVSTGFFSVLFILNWVFSNLLTFFSGERALFQACLKSLKSNYYHFLPDNTLNDPNKKASRQAYWRDRIDNLERQSEEKFEALRYDLSGIFNCELQLLAECSITVLERNAWTIQDRFERVVSDKMTNKHALSLSKITTGLNSDQLRADLGSLLCEIHNEYIFEIEREKAVRANKLSLLAWFGILQSVSMPSAQICLLLFNTCLCLMEILSGVSVLPPSFFAG